MPEVSETVDLTELAIAIRPGGTTPVNFGCACAAIGSPALTKYI